jgi:uncharacterized damage-inducible protein DinB
MRAVASGQPPFLLFREATRKRCRHYDEEDANMSADLLAATKEALSSKLEDYCTEIVQLIEPLDDKQLWQKPVEPGNSAGHLILHLTGNLNHFVGALLGKTGYVRDREREFTDANPPAKAVVEKNLKDVVALFRRIVDGLTTDQMTAQFPDPKFGTTIKTLIHLVSHFALHRGQISYLARLVKK